MSILGTQEKIQAPVGFFNKSIRGKRNEIIKKWASMSMFILFTCAVIPEKWGGGEEGCKQGRLMGDDGSVINWSIYAGLPIPLLCTIQLRLQASYHTSTKASPS